MGSEKNPKLETASLAELNAKLGDRTARIGVVGLGYVGLPLVLRFSSKGFRATGFDIDPEKITTLRSGKSYIRDVAESLVSEQLQENKLYPTDDFRHLAELDAILVCVPTPLDDHRDPDLTYVRNTAKEISTRLRPGQLIVLESTTYPGTTEEVVLPILAQSGLSCPVAPYSVEGGAVAAPSDSEGDFFLAFSPEREDPGSHRFPGLQIPKVIGGVNASSALAALALYRQVFDRTVLVGSSRVAEMTKLLENIYRCVNIALVNELKLLCLHMGIDIWEVIEAAKTKPFGFTAFYPGPGLGGHCIPIDPFYLAWKAREYDFPTRFIELAGEINTAMPEHVVSTLADVLNRRKRCLQDAKILVLGVAYKKDVDDLRESPALRIMQLLEARGARVDYNDPYIPRLHKTRHYDFRLNSVDLTPHVLSLYDAVLIATDHSAYDYPFVVKHSRLIIDTRNATQNVTEDCEKIIRC